MSCIFFNPFTSKKLTSFVFLALSVFLFNNENAIASDMKITGHYYVADDPSFRKYTDKVQWEVTNTFEFTKFLDNLKTLPSDLEKNNPMGLKQPELIHFKVENSDLKSGHDIFISKAGIQQFSKMPMDSYFDYNLAFKDFLESERTLNPGYDKINGELDINQSGIVVVYRGSKDLKNPYWVIKPSEKPVLERYKYFLKNLKRTINLSQDNMDSINEGIDTESTFILYLNYEDAPFDFIIMGTDGRLRGTKVSSQYSYFKDMIGYFSMFKRQAEDSLKASQKGESEPEEIRKKEEAHNKLF